MRLENISIYLTISDRGNYGSRSRKSPDRSCTNRPRRINDRDGNSRSDRHYNSYRGRFGSCNLKRHHH